MDGPQEKSLALSLRNIYETFSICWPTVIDAALHTGSKATYDNRLDGWCHRVIENARIRLNVVGRENAPPDKAYLIMSNHASLYDIPVLFCVFGKNTRMITKKELFAVPVFGPAMEQSGFISIDRGNRREALASLERAKNVLQSGTNVWIAPEGTRSKTGALLPFKKGGFNLSMDIGWPILPVTMKGTADVLGAKRVRSTFDVSITVTVHRPVDPAPYSEKGTKAGRDALMADVRRAIESAL